MFIDDIKSLELGKEYWFAYVNWKEPIKVRINQDANIRWHIDVTDSIACGHPYRCTGASIIVLSKVETFLKSGVCGYCDSISHNKKGVM